MIIMSLMVIFVTSCSDECNNPMLDSRLLSFTASITNNESRTFIEGTTMPIGSSVGVYLVDESDISYNGKVISNACFSTEDGIHFTTDDEITLSNVVGTMYAYWPYNPNATDMNAIPITDNDVDYLVSEPALNVSIVNAHPKLNMKHLMTRIRLVLDKTHYKGVGLMTEFSINSNALCHTGSLNLKTGSINPNEDRYTHTSSIYYTLSDTPWQHELMALTTGYQGELNLSFMIDRIEYYFDLQDIKFEAGKIYTFNIEFKS